MANLSYRVGKASFPDATNTGPVAGTSFTTTSGEIRSTADNQVIQNLDHTGYILIMHNNVTVQNCRINALNNDNAITRVTGNGMKVLHCEIFGNTDVMTDSTNHLNIAITTDDDTNAEIGHCNVYHIANVLNSYRANIHDNYFHDFVDKDLGGGEDFHVDGVQTYDASGYSGLIIRHNTIICISTAGQYTPVDWHAGTSCVISSPGQFGETFDNNLLAGGAFCLYGPNLAGGTAAANMVVTNNRFSTQYFTNAGTFGPYTGFDPTGSGFVWSGNVYHESGVSIPSP